MNRPKTVKTSREEAFTTQQTETLNHTRRNRVGRQARTGRVWEESATFTLASHQIQSVQALPLTAGHSDHTLKQVWRDQTHAVYKHLGCYGQFSGWESILIKTAPAGRIFGKDYPDREVYPGNEDFGRYALSVGAQYDLQYAIAKAKTLKAKSISVPRVRDMKTNLEQYEGVLGPKQTSNRNLTRTQT
jgi:hypothetical protein